jgi:acyl-coenzyme A thioesterase PaaI-like protein
MSTGSTCSDDVLADVARAINVLNERLTAGAQPSRYPGGKVSADLTVISRNHPMFGPANPISPPLVPEIEGGRVRMHVTYGPAYEGPAGFVHGGQIAAGFDGVLAVTGGVNGAGGLTRSLTIRYRRPTPLGVPLVYEGWVDATDERTTFIHGLLRNGDEVCAECIGEFARRHGAPSQPAAT